MFQLYRLTGYQNLSSANGVFMQPKLVIFNPLFAAFSTSRYMRRPLSLHHPVCSEYLPTDKALFIAEKAGWPGAAAHRRNTIRNDIAEFIIQSLKLMTVGSTLAILIAS